MFGFQTLACLHDIPVVRSSTNKIQDVYSKAKKTSAFIRLPCDLAESVADKSLKVALTVADPLVKPLRGTARAIDGFAVEKIRQIEAKYPVLTTPTEDVLNTLNEKTEPVRHAMTSVKDTTTSTIQQGKETVSNVALATVNKATNVADSVYTFCETHVPGKTLPVPRHEFGRRTTLLWERIQSTAGSVRDYAYGLVQSLLVRFRLLLVFVLLKIKQVNDDLLKQLQRQRLLFFFPQRLLIVVGTVLEHLSIRLRPDDRTVTEVNTNKQQTRIVQNKRPQTPQFVSRQTLKPDSFITTRQSVVVTNDETTYTRSSDSKISSDDLSLLDQQNLYPRLPTNESNQSSDVRKLHSQVKPTDVELLYARLPADTLAHDEHGQQPLTDDQRLLHAKVIGAALKR